MTTGGKRRAVVAGGGKEFLVHLPSISVIIPAFNEEHYLAETLDRLRAAEELLKTHPATPVQIIVVDNGSSDRTAEIALDRRVTVVRETDHNIAKVRNVGARAADRDIVVFLDADTLVPPELLVRIGAEMSDPACLGGAVDAAYRPRGRLMQGYLRLWRAIGIVSGIAQGACQFCRREIFVELGGYDESLYMGEDVDFFWRLRAVASRRDCETSFIRDLQVVSSARRFDNWPMWRTLLLTNPILVFALRRRRSPWVGWYEEAPR